MTRGESLEALHTLEDSLVAGSVQAHGKSFRARVAKGKQTVFGPSRATREAAEQDLRELSMTRGESLEALQATQARLLQNNTLEDSLVAGSVQAHGKSFRARVARGKQTVFGPSRATREAAEQDLRELNVTRGESLEALHTLEDSLVAGSVQAHGKSFRARVAKGKQTVFGPSRATREAAEQDLRELNVTRGESLEALQATQARLLQNNTLEDSLVAGSVQAHGKSFRARVAKGKQTVFGPPRATREAAEQDLRELNVTRGESLEALQATQARLFEARGREAIQNDMEQCFQFWFTEGSTEKPLPAKLQRFAAEGTGSELVSAERLLMEDFWLVEKVAQQPGVEWLQDLGLVLRLDYGSRPTGTSGLATSTSWAGLRSLGNTCYVNSLVQCFRACGPLRKDIGSAEDEKGSLGKLLSSLLHRLAENRWDFLAPFELVSELHRAEPIKFQVGEAAYSDVSECCATLLRTCVTDQNLILANQAHPEQGWVVTVQVLWVEKIGVSFFSHNLGLLYDSRFLVFLD